VDYTHRNRLIKSHFSLDNVKTFLKANDMSTVKKIILLHLSDQNSDAKRMMVEIQDITRRPVIIAEPGPAIQLEKAPF